jgi:hypothetical protein
MTMTVIGPFDRGDWHTMKKLRENMVFFKERNQMDVVAQYKGNLKEYFRKVA